jgi:hypothetical protein
MPGISSSKDDDFLAGYDFQWFGAWPEFIDGCRRCAPMEAASGNEQ